MSILRALSLGLHLDEDYLGNCHTAVDNQLRLLHYPRRVVPSRSLASHQSDWRNGRAIQSVPIKQIEKHEIERIGTHSDFGSITLLLQDSAGGLEVEDPHKPGTFMAATPVEGAIIVNAGDFLMRCESPTA